MQHFMVLAKDLEKTRVFYCDVLGLRQGPRPPFDFKGLWIYAGDVACIHVAERRSYAETSHTLDIPMASGAHGSGSVDHIAFAASDYDELAARLARHGVESRLNVVPGNGLRQLFVFDPDGIKIEINIPPSA